MNLKGTTWVNLIKLNKKININAVPSFEQPQKLAREWIRCQLEWQYTNFHLLYHNHELAYPITAKEQKAIIKCWVLHWRCISYRQYFITIVNKKNSTHKQLVHFITLQNELLQLCLSYAEKVIFQGLKSLDLFWRIGSICMPKKEKKKLPLNYWF